MVLRRKREPWQSLAGKARGLPSLITLTTDFGLSDHYVAAVKGVMLSIHPQVTIVDVSHDVQPQNVEQAAFLLECTYRYFPPQTVHVAVVDPGVGTERRALALQTREAIFIGPDNGILSAALPGPTREASGGQASRVMLTAPVKAFALTNDRFHRKPVSQTFHARDIFGPVAAHLTLGVAIEDLGPPVSEVLALPPFRATERPDGSLIGRVIHIDRFGNAISTIHDEQLPARAQTAVGSVVIDEIMRTYAGTEGPAAVLGSCGYLEIAMKGGSAANALRISMGDPVVVRPA